MGLKHSSNTEITIVPSPEEHNGMITRMSQWAQTFDKSAGKLFFKCTGTMSRCIACQA